MCTCFAQIDKQNSAISGHDQAAHCTMYNVQWTLFLLLFDCLIVVGRQSNRSTHSCLIHEFEWHIGQEKSRKESRTIWKQPFLHFIRHFVWLHFNQIANPNRKKQTALAIIKKKRDKAARIPCRSTSTNRSFFYSDLHKSFIFFLVLSSPCSSSLLLSCCCFCGTLFFAYLERHLALSFCRLIKKRRLAFVIP